MRFVINYRPELPTLPEVVTDGHKLYWVGTDIEVDWEKLVDAGYVEEREDCPHCGGRGYL